MYRVLAVVLAVASAPAFAAPCAGFTDVDDSNTFCANVAWIKNRNVTFGCTSATLYCPNDAVTRLAMAAFLNRLGDVLLPPNVIWVAPVGGMFQSIQAAIDYAATLPQDPRRLIKVAPGTYNEAITMAPFVDVEGSGAHATIIAATICGVGPPTSGTVNGASGSQLRDVTVLVRTFTTTPGECAAVYLRDVNGTALRDVTLEVGVSGSSVVYGVMLSASTFTTAYFTTLDKVSIVSFDVGIGEAVGIFANGSPVFPFPTLTLRDVQFTHVADFTKAIGYRLNNMVATLDRTSAWVANGADSDESTGLLVEGASARVTVERSALRVPGGLFGPAGQFATVSAGATLRIANSLLEGTLSGTATCFQNYDADFASVTC